MLHNIIYKYIHVCVYIFIYFDFPHRISKITYTKNKYVNIKIVWSFIDDLTRTNFGLTSTILYKGVSHKTMPKINAIYNGLVKYI